MMLLDLSILVGRWKKTKEHLAIASFRPEERRYPHWHPTIQSVLYVRERRRIVAQVRRKASKNNGFFAPRNKFTGCDDLLTLGVDTPIGWAYTPRH
jgi:hypothetical protein